MLSMLSFIVAAASVPLMALALVPHPISFVTSRGVSSSPFSQSTRLMYFDDAQRKNIDEWDLSDMGAPGREDPWILSLDEEKKQAMAQLLGYTPEAAAKRSEEDVENETLQWAIDTKVLWPGDSPEEDDDVVTHVSECKFAKIADLNIAQSKTRISSLAFLWGLLATLLEQGRVDSVYMVVFPKSCDLFNYDVMVTMLQAIQISTPLLPLDLEMDIFHPNYKHSPKMWSPETHSPFPTVAIQVKSKKESTIEEKIEDLDATRSKLNALFDVADADEYPNTTDQNSSPSAVLEACKAVAPDFAGKWVVETGKEPFQVYSRIWEALDSLREGRMTMVVAPMLDSHTTMRLAVTVNAALQKLESPIRISNVFHPNREKQQAPHAMIQLEFPDVTS